jgi:hypothetical protein
MTYFPEASLDTALQAIAAAATYISLHSASPGYTGANEISGGSPAYARVATTWAGGTTGSNGAGTDVGSQVTLNVPAGTTIGWFGIWSAVTAGTYYGGGALPNSETYTGQGTYLLTPTLNGTG